jgi:hypothetical protein
MKLAVLGLVLGVGCGSGSSKPVVEKPTEQPKRVNRVPIEDDSETSGDGQEDGVSFVKTKGSITREAIESGLAPHAAISKSLATIH